MKKVYYLATCDTCKRIMKEVGVDVSFEKREIKSQRLTLEEVRKLRNRVDSYDELLNKRSQRLKALNLKDAVLSEEEYENYFMQEYTFLKRPVFLFDDAVFIGNAKKNIENLKSYLSGK